MLFSPHAVSRFHPSLYFTVQLQLVTLFFFSCAGSWPTTPLSPGWPKAPAALGDQGQGTLWLRVEGSADEWLRSGENLPYSGERDTALGSYLPGASSPVLRCSKCLWRLCFLRPLQRCIWAGGKSSRTLPSYISLCIISLPNASCSSACCKKGKNKHILKSTGYVNFPANACIV